MLSKYMQGVVEKEEQRIRGTIVNAACDAFIKAGFQISISHDQLNLTERRFKTALGATFYALDSKTAKDSAGQCWLFAYKDKIPTPAHWVLFVTDNVEDILSDYSVSAESILAHINKISEHFM